MWGNEIVLLIVFPFLPLTPSLCKATGDQERNYRDANRAINRCNKVIKIWTLSGVELVNSRHPGDSDRSACFCQNLPGVLTFVSPQINNLILTYTLNPVLGSRPSPILSWERFISGSSINEYLLTENLLPAGQGVRHFHMWAAKEASYFIHKEALRNRTFSWPV